MLGIGIDTGGTCTDVVIYDLNQRRVLSSAKDQTTRPDLKTGILKALRKVPSDLLQRANYVALSTTLATNACVEDKGGRAGLVLIGAHPKVVAQNGPAYGLPPLRQLCLLSGQAGTPLDVDEPAFRAELREKCAGCDSVAVVQIDPNKDGGALERQAAQIVNDELGVPCVLGYTLFQERNVLRRGASALLNARLQPVMQEFLSAIQASLAELGIEVPVMIVRSDGTLMSRSFAGERPVETLLCGPAASVIGGQHLAGADQALIVDMGGTTTDVSVVRDGFPISVDEGIQVGGWKTMVHGVYVSTFALGGDTRVFHQAGTGYRLDQRRCVPLCALASRYPKVKDRLQTILERPHPHPLPLHEHLLLVRPLSGARAYTKEEQLLCRALESGPLPLAEAVDAAGTSLYALNTERLEQEGILLRSGVTPTDGMHLRGEYTAFDREAAELALRCLARFEGLDADSMGQCVNTLVVERMYRNLARILIQRHGGFPPALTEGPALDALTGHCYRAARSGADPFLNLPLTTPAALVGVGAPTHLYLPEVAALLGTRAILPEYASTANALGAAVSCISAEVTLELRPKSTWDGPNCYQLTGGGEPRLFSSLDEAVAEGRRLAGELAQQEARRRGALGQLTVDCWSEEWKAPAYDSTLMIGVDIHARAKAGYSR